MTKQEIQAVDLELETSLLKAMSVHDNFVKYSNVVDHKRLMGNTLTLLRDYEHYFNLYDTKEIDFGLFYTHFAQEWHSKDMDTPEVEYYRDYVFPAIKKTSGTSVEKCLTGLIEKQHAQDIVTACTHGLDVHKLRDIIDTYEVRISELTKTVDRDAYTAENVDLSILNKADGIPHFLPSVQEAIGSIILGDLILIPADANTGKTAYVVSQIAHTLQCIKDKPSLGPVLVFTSEDTEANVFARVWSNIYHKAVPEGFEKIVDNSEYTREKFVADYPKDSLIVIHMSNIRSVKDVKAKMMQYKPCLTIIDITDKLAPEEDATSLKKVYDELRLYATKYSPIMATTQAGVMEWTDKETGKTKSKKYLTLKDLYGSKTGKAGAATIVIGIGKDMDNPSTRYISTPKKKRGKEVFLTCELKEQYSLYKELVW